jgi:uncharacterized membrane protein affecting hemolysin expression
MVILFILYPIIKRRDKDKGRYLYLHMLNMCPECAHNKVVLNASVYDNKGHGAASASGKNKTQTQHHNINIQNQTKHTT